MTQFEKPGHHDALTHPAGSSDTTSVSIAPSTTILVIDDDPTIRLLVATGLERKGFRVEVAVDGLGGLAAFERLSPDLLVVDVSMPGMNGFDTVRAIRRAQSGTKGQHVPILMLTGSNDVASINAAFDAGATDFMTKPINLPLLAERVRYALRGAERERALHEAQIAQASACKLAHLGFWQLDLPTGAMSWSDDAADVLGCTDLPETAEAFIALVDEKDQQRLATALAVAIHNHEGLDLEITFSQGDGARVIHLQGDAQVDEHRLVGAFQDVTMLRALENRALYLLEHDELTGLPKRRLFLDMLRERLSNGDVEWLVAVVDINRLHRINEALGIQAGDQVLTLFAKRLKQHAPSQALVCRLEADAFAIAVPISAQSEPERLLRQWLDSLAQAQRIDHHDVYIDYSAGASLFPQDADCGEELLRIALQAQRIVRTQAMSQRILFHQQAGSGSHANMLSLEAHLRQALQKQEFFLVYQPQQDLTEGRIIGVEALLRWRHASRGVVSPVEFIPLLEETGLIVDVGDWVIGEACRQLAAWNQSGLKLRMGINLSAVQFSQPGLAQRLMDHVQANGLAPTQLELEITESVAMRHPEQTLALLQELHDLGFSLALDDFGTGHSSYNYLLRFPIDTLKIDRSFVIGVAEDRASRAIVRSLTALCQGLGFRTIAEGVETQRQRDYLDALNVDEMQGFLLARPLEAAHCEAFLLERAHSQPATMSLGVEA